MASTANGTAHNEGEWNTLRPDPVGQIRAGGIGRVPGFAEAPDAPDDVLFTVEKQYLPGQPKSLSGIATNAFLLGLVLSTSLVSTVSILALTNSSLWRITAFLSMLSLFHFLEFWTTATYNTRAAQVSSFLLSQNGSAYNIAHGAAMVECLVRNTLLKNMSSWLLGFVASSWVIPYVTGMLICVGLVLIVVGQILRSVAMAQAGTNFNHVVQYRRQHEHQLVTTGVYHYLRHPSYFGFFWWGLGTQLVLGNFFCFFGYMAVLWSFFSNRISGEEELLVLFFGNDYVRYREKTPVGIPFIK